LDRVDAVSTAGSGVSEYVGKAGLRRKLRVREGMINGQVKPSVADVGKRG